MEGFSKIFIVGRHLLMCMCPMLIILTAWDTNWGRAATCTAAEIMIEYIIFVLIAIVVMIIVVVVINMVIKEGWLNEVIGHGYVTISSSLQILHSGV